MDREIDYRKLMRKAFRQTIADVLAEVAEHGLPGEHHFFIVFDTRHPGVDMAPSLKARFPDQMTIVLQEWFTDLAVMKDRFTVTLNFGDVAEPLVIPFEAILKFVDPSVEFGLSFVDSEGENEGADEEETEHHEGTVIPFHPSRKT